MQTPAPFEYERATSIEGAIASLQRLDGEGRIIAGGHSLLPMMKLRLATPEYLIDINDLDELAYIREHGDEVLIGALTRHADLEHSELLAEKFPVFGDAEQVIADPVVRNSGTIGGSLCQADAAEDLSSVCLALKAKAVLRGVNGERVIKLDRFYLGPFMTTIGEAKLLTEVRIPLRPRLWQRPREGRAPRRRLRDRRGLGRDLGPGRDDRRRWPGAQRGRPDHGPRRPRQGAAARLLAIGGSVRARGRDRFGGLRSARGRTRTGRLRAPSRRRTEQTRPPPRDGSRPETGGLALRCN
jgi:FAD binding domain in molybdopterin dehydrogenase